MLVILPTIITLYLACPNGVYTYVCKVLILACYFTDHNIIIYSIFKGQIYSYLVPNKIFVKHWCFVTNSVLISDYYTHLYWSRQLAPSVMVVASVKTNFFLYFFFSVFHPQEADLLYATLLWPTIMPPIMPHYSTTLLCPTILPPNVTQTPTDPNLSAKLIILVS